MYLAGGDWNMTGLFFDILGIIIIPIDELIFFRGFQTTSQVWFVDGNAIFVDHHLLLYNLLTNLYIYIQCITV